MKLNTTIKTLCAAVALATSAAASANLVTASNADFFYLNPGALGSGVADATNCATCTQDANFGSFKYTSTTTLDLVAKTFSTTFGWNGSSLVTPSSGDFALGTNNVISFNPDGLYNGYGFNVTGSPTWGVTFDGNAAGTFSVNDDGEVILSYNTGKINLYLLSGTYAASTNTYTNLGNFMDINIIGGKMGPGNTFIDGVVSFDQPISTYANLFHADGGTPNCAAGNGFAQIAACGEAAPIWTTLNFNTQDPVLKLTSFTDGVVTGQHNGTIQFDVPEPASLALLGVGLFGLGAIRRRKSA